MNWVAVTSTSLMTADFTQLCSFRPASSPSLWPTNLSFEPWCWKKAKWQVWPWRQREPLLHHYIWGSPDESSSWGSGFDKHTVPPGRVTLGKCFSWLTLFFWIKYFEPYLGSFNWHSSSFPILQTLISFSVTKWWVAGGQCCAYIYAWPHSIKDMRWFSWKTHIMKWFLKSMKRGPLS